MVFRRVLAGLLAAGFATLAMAAPANLEFFLRDDQVVASLPEGWCAPTGRYVDIAEQLFDADARHIRYLTLFDCAQMRADQSVSKVIAIAIPRAMISASITRPDLMQAFRTLPGQAPPSAPGTAPRRISLGYDLRVVDLDDYAQYAMGKVSRRNGDGAVEGVQAIATTALKGHVVAYIINVPGGSDPTALLTSLKAQVRAFIDANGG